ncbi:minor tail protein [Mycobacterium phage Rajelicia]|nr:minor tail protein [Mycobacterium phage Rajelicia]
MSLKVGGLDVVGVFVGDAAAKIYVGAMRIWPPVPDFTPFSISSEDPGYTDIYDEPVPEGASGCWVTLVGGGGGGRAGYRGTSSNRPGGPGGGGGSKIPRVWIPRELMGDTYSVSTGIGGLGGEALVSGGGWGPAPVSATASYFRSGDVNLTAGFGGYGGANAGGTGNLGSILQGVPGAVLIPGTDGGRGATSATTIADPGVDNPNGAGAGGGGGGCTTSGGSPTNGAKGGDSTHGTGGVGGSISGTQGGNAVDQEPGNPGAGGGGGRNNQGGNGGNYGGGGGGGAGGSTAYPGGDGGDGYVLIEWE